MSQYVKDGHVIIASEKAYRLIYHEQGYLPAANNLTPPEEPEKPADSAIETQNGTGLQPVPPEPPVDNPLESEKTLENMSYAELKEMAKGLEIPKYANTKQADLITLIQGKLSDADGTKN